MTSFFSISGVDQLVGGPVLVVDIEVDEVLKGRENTKESLFDVGLRNLFDVIAP